MVKGIGNKVKEAWFFRTPDFKKPDFSRALHEVVERENDFNADMDKFIEVLTNN